MKKLRLGVLFSGGKDSTLALAKAMECEQVVCLITLESLNSESYMFHTPNISLTGLQAEALGLPIITQETSGQKEKELTDLRKVVVAAVKQHGIEGIVTGAVESIYQAERVQRICRDLGLWCFNPLWKKDQLGLLEELVDGGYEVMISGVFAYPLAERHLGRRIDAALIAELAELQRKFKISPSGEGGEIETTVLDCPVFGNRIEVEEGHNVWDGRSGKLVVDRARLVRK